VRRAAEIILSLGKGLKEVTMRVILTIGLVFAFCRGAQAASEDLRERCDSPSSNPAAATKACTSIIDSLDDGYVIETAYLHRGIAYQKKGNYAGAIADFSEAINLNPAYADAYFHRGTAYRAKGDYDSAIADLDQAIQLDPKDPEGYNCRGEAYRDKGDYDRAIADFDHALEIEPAMRAAANNKAKVLEKLGKGRPQS
jgi:tetratricopeptide (TPR) repeat protein